MSSFLYNDYYITTGSVNMLLDEIMTKLKEVREEVKAFYKCAKEHHDTNSMYYYRGQVKAFDYALSLLNILDKE